MVRTPARFTLVAGMVAAATAGGALMAPRTGADTPEIDPLHPQGHFALERPGDLSKADATTVYDGIADFMARGYAGSGDETARTYRRWARYNDAPYRSQTHGNRYVNNYANAIAARAGYGDPKEGMSMPPGAVLAKDSFTYTGDRALFAGALFIMEKLAQGANPATGDWRYAMIMPDGSVFGDTTTETAERLDFCHACHAEKAAFDYLFFLPEGYRRQIPND